MQFGFEASMRQSNEKHLELLSSLNCEQLSPQLHHHEWIIFGKNWSAQASFLVSHSGSSR